MGKTGQIDKSLVGLDRGDGCLYNSVLDTHMQPVPRRDLGCASKWLATFGGCDRVAALEHREWAQGIEGTGGPGKALATGVGQVGTEAVQRCLVLTQQCLGGGQAMARMLGIEPKLEVGNLGPCVGKRKPGVLGKQAPVKVRELAAIIGELALGMLRIQAFFELDLASARDRYKLSPDPGQAVAGEFAAATLVEDDAPGCESKPAGHIFELFRQRSPVGRHEFSRMRGSRGPDVGNEVANRDIDFVADRRDNGHRAGRNRAGKCFVVKRPQILSRSTATPHDNDVDVRLLLQAQECFEQARRRGLALDKSGGQENP